MVLEQKKKKKRMTTITDSNGWTHVVTPTKTTTATNNNKCKYQLAKDVADHPKPAEAPQELTISKLNQQFLSFREKWTVSHSWTVILNVLQQQQGQRITTIISLGLGSPSGLLRDGLIDRRNISMYQLAGLASIVDFYRSSNSSSYSHLHGDYSSHSEGGIKVYAQDPVFNDLDKTLLSSLGIIVLPHPGVFDYLRDANQDQQRGGIFLYCPGAERVHIEQLLSSLPFSSSSQQQQPTNVLLFGNSLDNHDFFSFSSSSHQQVISSFLKATNSIHIPTFDHCEYAFWDMRLYYNIQSPTR